MVSQLPRRRISYNVDLCGIRALLFYNCVFFIDNICRSSCNGMKKRGIFVGVILVSDFG